MARTSCNVAVSGRKVARRVSATPICLGTGLVALVAISGCMSLPRATCSDREFADYMHTQAEKLPIAGIYELRTAAAGGHVTLGGRVESPESLKQLVAAIASTPGLTELSFFGVEFAPADIPDDVIVANARETAASVIGEELASQLGCYCEDHRLFVYGKLPNDQTGLTYGTLAPKPTEDSAPIVYSTLPS